MRSDQRGNRGPADIVRISDGLGNQMFQYAFARKLQLSGRRTVYLDTRFINHEDEAEGNRTNFFHKKCGYRSYGLGNFNIRLAEAGRQILTKWDFLSRRNDREKLLFHLSQCNLWPWQYRSEDSGKAMLKRKSICSTYFQGYFFDLRYFDDIRGILQRDFTVRKAVRLPAGLRKVLETENTVGVHVRKGDFSRLSRDISRTDYYPRALQRMNNDVEQPVYLVFSDDIEWVKGNIRIDGRTVYISGMGLADYEELAVMKHCRHQIIANSTFSYWAAYLNDHPDKTVICPGRWKPDIIPAEWTVL